MPQDFTGDSELNLTTSFKVGGTGLADPAAARPIILPTTYANSKKFWAETVAAGPIIPANYNIHIINEVYSTIYNYAIARTRNSKLVV